MIFNYGTELVGINCHEKLGSTSIKMTTDYGLKKYEEDVIRYHYRNKKYVVVVRDVIKRWKSGYIQDMIGAFVNTDNEWKKHNVVSKNNVFWETLMNVEVDSFNILSAEQNASIVRDQSWVPSSPYAQCAFLSKPLQMPQKINIQNM